MGKKMVLWIILGVAFTLGVCDGSERSGNPSAQDQPTSLTAQKEALGTAYILRAQEEAKQTLPISDNKQHDYADQSISDNLEQLETPIQSLFGINYCWIWWANPTWWQGVWAIQELRDDGWSYFQDEASCKSTLRNLTPVALSLGYYNPLYLALVAVSYAGGSCACEKAL
jgi:hypothetical protein